MTTNGRLLYVMVAVMLIGMMGAFAVTVSTVSPSAGAPGQVTTTAQGSVAAEGGNTTQVDLTSDSNTQNWQGFYGNVTGSLRLGDGASVLYDFGLTTFQAVFASLNDSVPFASVTGLGGAGQQVTADGFFGFPSGPDNISTVVDDLAGCAAGTEIAAAGAITTLNSSSGDWSADTCFAGTDAAPANIYEYVWGTDLVSAGEESFVAGLEVQYQLMVPVDTTGDLYYFYLEI